MTSPAPAHSSAGLEHSPAHATGESPGIQVKRLGRVDYAPTWQAMHDFTASRSPGTADELWIVEHPPVYTVGLAGRSEHFPREMRDIPLVKTDRGGQITYHGPGQVIVYALVDLVRRGIKVREMVCLLEQAVIDLLAAQGIAAQRRDGAPGVYIAAGNQSGAKIAALGLKVKRGGCYHGVSLNVDMDLAPFTAIDPCGYPGMAVTRLRDMGSSMNIKDAGEALAHNIAAALPTPLSKGADWPQASGGICKAPIASNAANEQESK